MLHPINIIDKNNRLTGEVSDPEDASNRGLWHRGAHAILITPSKRVLVQRRDQNAIQHPNMIELGVGGFVDSGETPEQTVIREVREETGLDVKKEQITFLGLTKYNHRWRFKDRQKITRTIIYSYAIRLDSDQNDLHPQRGEVAWSGFIPLKSARWLMRRGSLRQLGHLLPTYAYYRKIMFQTMNTFVVK